MEYKYVKLCFLSSAVGCPDPVPPIHGWVRRMDNEVHMGCNATGESIKWKMTCENNHWVGSYENCTHKGTL